MRNHISIGISILSVRRTVCVLSALAVFGVGFSQDYARLSERTIIGTARYVGMSGAMTAIGGDPSAVTDNPAGLGLYRRAEAMVTMDIGIDKTLQKDQEKAEYNEEDTHNIRIILKSQETKNLEHVTNTLVNLPKKKDMK